jgi:hypothetical protein
MAHALAKSALPKLQTLLTICSLPSAAACGAAAGGLGCVEVTALWLLLLLLPATVTAALMLLLLLLFGMTDGMCVWLCRRTPSASLLCVELPSAIPPDGIGLSSASSGHSQTAPECGDQAANPSAIFIPCLLYQLRPTGTSSSAPRSCMLLHMQHARKLPPGCDM